MIDPAVADLTVALFTDALSGSTDAAAVLRDWSRRYPELESEFAAIAAERQFGEPRDDADTAKAQADLMSRIAAEARTRFLPVSSTYAAGAPAGRRPATLPEAAAARGLAYPVELAAQLRLPGAIVERIASRRIPFSTLPAVLIQQMADALGAARDDIATWLTAPQGPALATGFVRERSASYNISTSFSDAVATSPDMDEADRAYWLSVQSMSRDRNEWNESA